MYFHVLRENSLKIPRDAGFLEFHVIRENRVFEGDGLMNRAFSPGDRRNEVPGPMAQVLMSRAVGAVGCENR